MRRLGLFICVLLWFPLILSAQADTTPYDWIEANLALVYPADWEPPVSLIERGGALSLHMAQTLTTQPDVRPAAVPTLTLVVIPNTEVTADPAAFIEEYLAAQSTPAATSPADAAFMGVRGFTVSGASADGALFGVGRAARLDDGRVLVLVGRTPVDQRSAFLRRYDAVAASIVPLETVSPAAPQYGALWVNIMTSAAGDAALLNPRALAYDAGAGLVVVDSERGLLRVDAQNGKLTPLVSTPLIAAVTDAAVGSSGNLYLADPTCPCIRIFDPAGIVQGQLEGFAEGAPLSLAAAPDGAVYATDISETGFAVRVFRGGTTQVIPLDSSSGAQPELLIDGAGRLLAVSPGGAVFALDGDVFAPLFTLSEIPPFFSDAAAVGGGIALAAERDGVLLYDSGGSLVGSVGTVTDTAALPGDLVVPSALAVGTDGTIYIADGDGSFGAITAMRANADPNRLGGQMLVPEVTVQGILSESAPQQAWTYQAAAGERITLSAVDASGVDALDVALRLIAPDGAELAYNNDQALADLYSPFDAQIVDQTLPIDGIYTILVESVGGGGVYFLGLNRTERLDPGAGEVRAALDEALPTDRWLFDAPAGATYTITMRALSGDLDPALRLIAPDGSVLAENDDADDTTLGLDAQIGGVTLPAAGTYLLEAARFTGTGDYALTVESAAP